MKALFVSILLLFATPALALDKCVTGSWYDPATEHEGVNVEVLDEVALVYYYTYSFFDRANQNWVLFVGEPDSLDAYDTLPVQGGADEYTVGTGSIRQIDENTLELSYDFRLNLDAGNGDPKVVTPWCLDGRCQATIVLKRLTQPIPCS